MDDAFRTGCYDWSILHQEGDSTTNGPPCCLVSFFASHTQEYSLGAENRALAIVSRIKPQGLW